MFAFTASVCAAIFSLNSIVSSEASVVFAITAPMPTASAASAPTTRPIGFIPITVLSAANAADRLVAPATAVLIADTAPIMAVVNVAIFAATNAAMIALMPVTTASQWVINHSNTPTSFSNAAAAFLPAASQLIPLRVLDIESMHLRIVGSSLSHIVRRMPSSWLFRSVNLPPTLLSIVFAMRSAAPALLFTDWMSCSKSSGAEFTIASKPAIASWPAIALAWCACSASESPLNFERSCLRISISGSILPAESVTVIPSSSIESAAIFGGEARRVIIERSAVPARSPLIPAFAIVPMATATSSIEKPSAPATGVTYWNVEPMSSTFVFALAAAAAITSASLPASFASYPRPVNASVTISDVSAKSAPEAAARFRIPSKPSSISLVFQPAIAM